MRGLSPRRKLSANSPHSPFAMPSHQCDNTFMQNTFTSMLSILAAGMILLGSAQAQQTAPANPPKTPPAAAQSSTAPKTTQKPAAAKHPATLVLKTQKEKASYAIGMNIGKSLHNNALDNVDPNILLRGLKDALAGNKPLLTDADAQAALTAAQADARKIQEEKMRIAAEPNKKAGEAFLAANKSQPGVVALPSGLQYKILSAGTGPTPSATDTVVCNYRGTLLDNTEFDSSYKRGQPAKFPVSGVIKGWTEALQLMPVGSKWQLFIPSDLAYGDQGRGNIIAPGATLVFEVELLSIEPKPVAK